MEPLLTVVAVSYHGSREVGGLLASLAAQTDPRWRVVLVDNSVSEEEADRLRALVAATGVDPSRVELLVAPTNLGYFGGARLALDELSARGEEAGWVAVTNVDVRLAADFVAILAGLSADAVLAPSIRSTATRRDQNPFLTRRPARRQVTRWYWQTRSLALSRLVVVADHAVKRVRPAPRAGEAGPIYAPHGSCILFPPAWFERGGTLDHEPFLFAEELTVAERSRDLGLPVRYEPRLKVEHDEHRSTGLWRSAVVLRSQRDAAAYARRLLVP